MFLLLSLGISFGFIATIVAITHASWFRLPAGVADGEYVSLGRRTGDEVSRLTLADFENVQQLAPEVAWFYHRRGQLRIQDPLGDVRRIQAPRVSGRFFDLLGVGAAAGTLVGPGQGPAAVLSHDLWQRMFGGGMETVGDLLEVSGGMSVPIVGVAEPAFADILGERPDAWILDAPFDLTGPPERDPQTAREIHRKYPDSHIFGVVQGLASERAVASLSALFADYAFDTSGIVERHEAAGEEMSLRILSYGVLASDSLIVAPGLETDPDRARAVQQRLVWLVAIVALLLAMALVSLIDFLLAENLARAEEQTVRIAIGAGPADVFRRTMAENAIWIVVVAALGWLSSRYAAELLLGVEPFSAYIGALPDSADLVGLAIGALLLATAFAFGAAYASWFVSKTSRAIAAGRASERLARLTRSTLLFVGAASLLLVFSLVGRYAGDARFSLKFENADVLGVTIHHAQAQVAYRALLDPIDAMPGVRASATASSLPLADARTLAYSRGRLRGEPGLEDTPFYGMNVSARFIETLGLPLLAGRWFDTAAENEAVISRAAAVALGGDLEAALGKPVVFWREQLENMAFPDGFNWEPPAVTVVGVVEDVPYGEYSAAAARVIYEPWRAQVRSTFHRLLIDYEGAPEDILGMIRAAPAFEGWEVMGSGTPEARFREQFMAKRSVEMVLSGAAAFALLLALAGVANSLARSLAEARRAMGIRLALGATTFDLSRRYAGAVLGDLLLVAVLVGGLAFAARLMAPTATELLDLWLLIPATLCLAAICAAVAHALAHQFSRRGRLNPLIQGAG